MRVADRDSHLAAVAQLRDRLLRHAKVDVDRIERLERHHRVASRQVLSAVDVADAEQAGERRPDGLALDRRPDLADAGVALAGVGDRAIELSARDDVLVEQPLHAVEVHPRQFALGFGGCQLCLLLPRVEASQQLAFVHRLARVECDELDGAGKIGTDRHALHGGCGANGGQRGRPVFLSRHNGRHRLGRRLERRSLPDGGLDLL